MKNNKNISLIHKINDLCKSRSLTVSKMLQECGLNASVVDNIKKGSTPNIDSVSRIANYFEVSVDYLLGLSPSPKNLTYEEMLEKIGAIPVAGEALIPILGKVIAGSPNWCEENHEGYMAIDYSPADEYFALRVYNDSMEDDGIVDGSIVVVHKQSTADNGDTVIALLNGNEATIKKYKIMPNGQILLMPANAKYTPILITEECEMQVIGVVVEVRTKLHKAK